MEHTLEWKKRVVSNFKPQTFLSELVMYLWWLLDVWLITAAATQRWIFVMSKLVSRKSSCMRQRQVGAAGEPHEPRRCLKRFKGKFHRETGVYQWAGEQQKRMDRRGNSIRRVKFLQELFVIWRLNQTTLDITEPEEPETHFNAVTCSVHQKKCDWFVGTNLSCNWDTECITNWTIRVASVCVWSQTGAVSVSNLGVPSLTLLCTTPFPITH